MKVELQRKAFAPFGSVHGRERIHTLTHSLPFYRAFMGQYIHRVRYGYLFVELPDSYNRTRYSFTMWCGAHGSVHADPEKPRYHGRGQHRIRGSGGELFGVVPETGVCCATCEGRVIGAGLTESRMIAGRMLVFSPRL